MCFGLHILVVFLLIVIVFEIFSFRRCIGRPFPLVSPNVKQLFSNCVFG